ncbi:Ctr copper transporter, partial [Aspergillus sclerotioniger CBS 115572]
INMAMSATTIAMSADSTSTSMAEASSNCQISMLWNWDTVGTCFITSSWHNTSPGMFAGSCIGTFCLVLILEFLRRATYEYDAFIVNRARLRVRFLAVGYGSSTTAIATPAPAPAPMTTEAPSPTTPSSCCYSRTNNIDCKGMTLPPPRTPPTPPSQSQPQNLTPMPFAHRPTFPEQIIRAILHTVQFAVAYLIMLLAMYFNGYIIFCIFIGTFSGFLVFGWG